MINKSRPMQNGACRRHRGTRKSPWLLFVILALSGCQDPPGEGQGEGQGRDNAQDVHQRPETPASAQPSPPPALNPETIAANNRAVGLMGRFEYAAAFDIFAKLAKEQPHWPDARINLAIATLNRQQEGDEAAALALADRVLARHPGHLRAHYIAGLLRLYRASPAQALEHFAQVAEGDPNDAHAAYYLGQCLARQSEPEKALAAYRRALALDPYLRSAAYGAFQILQRLGRRDEARGLIEQYQRLAANPRAKLAEFKYTRMGPKAEALAVGAPAGKQTTPRPHGPIFADKRPLPVVEETGSLSLGYPGDGTRPVSITVMDLQSDGLPDLFVAGGGDSASSLLLMGTPDGRFAPRKDHPLTRVPHVNAVLWGDFDNDGRPDAYLCRRGPNQLWRNQGQGVWRDVTAATDTWNGTFDTVDGAFFDADHDGDLDLFLVNEDGPNGLLYNNRDGTFRTADIGGTNREPAAMTDSVTVIPADLDRDRDTDIIVLNRAPPHGVYINDRLWAYHAAPEFAAFQSVPALAATVGNVDSDGLPEIYTLTPQGALIRWSRDERGRGIVPTPLAIIDKNAHKKANKKIDWAQMALFDAEGDGVLDLLIATPAGWSVIRVPERPKDARGEETLFTATGSLLGVTPLLLDPGKGFGMVGLSAGDEAASCAMNTQPDEPPCAALVHWPAGSGRHPYLALTFSGMEEAAKSMRSNASGIGSRISARAGTRWTIAENFRGHSGPGQGLQPMPIGLGGAGRLDFVTVDWSDGVLQTELDLEAGRRHHITETQRQLSSCPVLFAWDGKKYAFITDFLGVGGLGYAIAPGEYSTPRPWENLLLPSDVRPRQGHYALKLTEPMEEAAYLDAVGLTAYDLPPGWRMALDERMGLQSPEPTGAPVFYRREILPEKAVNERGETVTAAVTRADGRAAPVGPLDRRFIGRLAHEHILTLTFPPVTPPPSSSPRGLPGSGVRDDKNNSQDPPVLIIDGWVEYPYSQTMFAAWQADAAWEAPTIEVRVGNTGSDDKWRPLLTRFGYPAGMPRRMSVPLKGLPKGATALRIRTNQEIYWDRIAIAFPEPLPHLKRHTLPLASARLGIVGFPKRTDGPQRHPRFDYNQRRPFWDTRPMAGFYTKSGPVHELLAQVDDALAIFGAGEEIHVEFTAPSGPPPPGWRRHLVLETHGWTKDRDFFTRDGETIGPLPESGRAGERRAELHARYNTRAVLD
uniref:Tetratricopeptide repeat-containing protein n=1 Tax=Candidatus Kentrum eta TaxID=2126337 RepID=A0A450UNT8_9GAMM|nr:MAG: Tetratricopeptide repeat-containing protein [Candidatus Kentron sp. H]VFJ94196.1 MAG: Tetratricopeptide repeat-containing protein [Candidatus Kentron sp. H]VFK00875.1 MAG: Tetratricopeptide repeat-containing protein [Candidatus Kentron sp. H]